MSVFFSIDFLNFILKKTKTKTTKNISVQFYPQLNSYGGMASDGKPWVVLEWVLIGEDCLGCSADAACRYLNGHSLSRCPSFVDATAGIGIRLSVVVSIAAVWRPFARVVTWCRTWASNSRVCRRSSNCPPLCVLCTSRCNQWAGPKIEMGWKRLNRNPVLV